MGRTLHLRGHWLVLGLDMGVFEYQGAWPSAVPCTLEVVVVVVWIVGVIVVLEVVVVVMTVVVLVMVAWSGRSTKNVAISNSFYAFFSSISPHDKLRYDLTRNRHRARASRREARSLFGSR